MRIINKQTVFGNILIKVAIGYHEFGELAVDCL